MQLQIYHSGWRDSLPMFEVVRSTDMKRTTEIQVPSPMTFPVINRPADMLLPELRWYMEDYFGEKRLWYPSLIAATAALVIMMIIAIGGAV